ncbi:hypothetical protein PAPYR_3032 [Paratrimastix pyriformis]|uniref:Uncharacterized protein n=1 Tax=Paratrimastix pyriformis TaxID=342808 RepID=A0ABQ8UNM8_9EUKA|nr:hypothetical protein PAPYR_3032 [Paratrimastix pyriformis]
MRRVKHGTTDDDDEKSAVDPAFAQLPDELLGLILFGQPVLTVGQQAIFADVCRRWRGVFSVRVSISDHPTPLSDYQLILRPVPTLRPPSSPRFFALVHRCRALETLILDGLNEPFPLKALCHWGGGGGGDGGGGGGGGGTPPSGPPGRHPLRVLSLLGMATPGGPLRGLLPRLGNLRVLRLTVAEDPNGLLGQLGRHCPLLEGLCLQGPTEAAAFLRADLLAALPRLRHLSAISLCLGPEGSPGGLAPGGLETLVCRYEPRPAALLARCGGPGLRHLEVQMALSEAAFEGLLGAGCTRLECLVLPECAPLGPAALAFITANAALTRFVCRTGRTAWMGVGLPPAPGGGGLDGLAGALGQLQGLEEVEVEFPDRQADLLALVPRLPRLRRCLVHMSVPLPPQAAPPPFGWEPPAGALLTDLALIQCRLAGARLVLPSLRRAQLRGCTVERLEVAAPRLEALDMGGTRVHQVLLRCPALARWSCPEAPADVVALCPMPCLEALPWELTRPHEVRLVGACPGLAALTMRLRGPALVAEGAGLLARLDERTPRLAQAAIELSGAPLPARMEARFPAALRSLRLALASPEQPPPTAKQQPPPQPAAGGGSPQAGSSLTVVAAGATEAELLLGPHQACRLGAPALERLLLTGRPGPATLGLDPPLASGLRVLQLQGMHGLGAPALEGLLGAAPGLEEADIREWWAPAARLRVHGPRLRRLGLTGATRLGALELSCPRLAALALAHCPVLAALVLDCPALGAAQLAACPSLRRVQLRRPCPTFALRPPPRPPIRIEQPAPARPAPPRARNGVHPPARSPAHPKGSPD